MESSGACHGASDCCSYDAIDQHCHGAGGGQLKAATADGPSPWCCRQASHDGVDDTLHSRCTALALPHARRVLSQEQNTDIVNALAGDVHLLENPDHSGLLPLGLAVAWHYLDVARTVLQVPE